MYLHVCQDSIPGKVIFKTTSVKTNAVRLRMWHDILRWKIVKGHLLLRSNQTFICAISGFRREVADNCALLDYQAASSGNFLTTISIKIWYKSNTTVIYYYYYYYYVECQINDNMFRPFLILTRPSSGQT